MWTVLTSLFFNCKMPFSFYILVTIPATFYCVLSNEEKKYAQEIQQKKNNDSQCIVTWFILIVKSSSQCLQGLRYKLELFSVVMFVNSMVPFVPCRRTQSVSHEPLRRQGSSTTSRPPQPLSAQAIKHIWVRTALFEKVLDKIVEYIVDNSRWFVLFFAPCRCTAVTHSTPLQALL